MAHERGSLDEASLATPKYPVAIMTFIGKLRLHVQECVNFEGFHVMLAESCDLLLGMPCFQKIRTMIDIFKRKIAPTHKKKGIVLDVKLQGECIPLVSALAISNVIKKSPFCMLDF